MASSQYMYTFKINFFKAIHFEKWAYASAKRMGEVQPELTGWADMVQDSPSSKFSTCHSTILTHDLVNCLSEWIL